MGVRRREGDGEEINVWLSSYTRRTTWSNWSSYTETQPGGQRTYWALNKIGREKETERRREGDNQRQSAPKDKTANISTLFYCPIRAIFLRFFPPARVEETTHNCMSWRYIKVAGLVELLWRLRSSRRCTLKQPSPSVPPENLLIREEKPAGANEITLVCCHDSSVSLPSRENWYQTILWYLRLVVRVRRISRAGWQIKTLRCRRGTWRVCWQVHVTCLHPDFDIRTWSF